MPPSAPISPSINARIIHASLVLGVLVFWATAWYIGSRDMVAASQLPDRRVLYVSLFVVSAILLAGALFAASRLPHPVRGASQDEWWRANLGRAVVVWALIEAPTLLGLVAYLLTRDFRTLIAPFAGLLLFVNFRPGRLTPR